MAGEHFRATMLVSLAIGAFGAAPGGGEQLARLVLPDAFVMPDPDLRLLGPVQPYRAGGGVADEELVYNCTDAHNFQVPASSPGTVDDFTVRWQADHPNCDFTRCLDINHDGSVDGDDIYPFFDGPVASGYCL